MTSTLLQTEHQRGLHGELFKPSKCADCYPDGPPSVTRTVVTVPTPAPEPVAPTVLRIGPGNLAAALERLRASWVVDQPAEPDGEPVGHDGGPFCAVCQGVRWLRRDVPRSDPDFGRAVQCPECARGFLLQRRLDRLWGGLPEMFRGWTIDTLAQQSSAHTDLARELRSWLKETSKPWLYLYGPAGRGKTGAAVGLLHEATCSGQSATLKVVPDLLERIRRAYRTKEAYDADETDLLEALYAVDLLVLDDLGSERVTDWTIEKIFQVIGARHDERKRTIITSNITLEQLTEALGNSRTASRIGEMTAGQRWVLDVSRLPNLRTRMSPPKGAMP